MFMPNHRVRSCVLVFSCLASGFACGGEGDSESPGGPSNVAGVNGTGAAPSGAGTGVVGTSGNAGSGNVGGSSASAGATTGGSATAGVTTGGNQNGGAATGGTANAGSMNGGSTNAGSANGGRANAGSANGGSGGTPTDNDCNTPPALGKVLGWASQGSSTTGGGDAKPVVVTRADELSAQLKGNDAKVIYVKGKLQGSFAVGSNKSLVGVCGAEIHGHIGISGSSNVIIRNLKLVGNNCTDSPQDCSAGADAMTLGSGANHVWIDHLDISDGSDGNLDITQGSDFVTVSWTKFSYSSKRSDPDAGASGHRFSNLIGSSDTEPLDVGHLNVTYHHCWWAQNVDQRMPRTRRGQIHVYNNLYTASGNSYCTNAGQDAKLLVQNNVYAGVNAPLQVSANGNMKQEGNDFLNTTGNKSASGTGFTPPYSVQLDATSTLRAAIEAGAGPHD